MEPLMETGMWIGATQGAARRFLGFALRIASESRSREYLGPTAIHPLVTAPIFATTREAIAAAQSDAADFPHTYAHLQPRLVRVYEETVTTPGTTERRAIELGGPIPAGAVQVGFAQRFNPDPTTLVTGVIDGLFDSHQRAKPSDAHVFRTLDELATAVQRRNIRMQKWPDLVMKIDPLILVDIHTPGTTSTIRTVEEVV